MGTMLAIFHREGMSDLATELMLMLKGGTPVEMKDVLVLRRRPPPRYGVSGSGSPGKRPMAARRAAGDPVHLLGQPEDVRRYLCNSGPVGQPPHVRASPIRCFNCGGF